MAKSLAEVLAKTKADVVMHTTNSYFDLFKGQVLEILKAGLDVVSTSEELSFPWLAHPQDAAEIDAAAKKAGKTVLSTGVNPGLEVALKGTHGDVATRSIAVNAIRRVKEAAPGLATMSDLPIVTIG